MSTSPRRSSGKRKARRRAPEINSSPQLRAWKAWAANACITAPLYVPVTVHVPQLPPGRWALLAALAGSALVTWMNTRGMSKRR